MPSINQGQWHTVGFVKGIKYVITFNFKDLTCSVNLDLFVYFSESKLFLCLTYSDLKPDNVLVDKDGHIKICDFGLAKENIDGQRKNYGLAGTRGYRAPEVLLQDEYNAAVDWWSFGVIMYEMATGKLPYSTSGSILNQTYAIMTETPDYPSYMSEEMLDLLSKLLESDDTKRIGLNGNIREHPFYSTINWDDLENRRLETPFQPGMPSADDFYDFPLPFSTHNCNGKNLKDFSEVDPNWNWQE
ncbi:protein kinase C delta type-like [Xenopus laevis]|uniref:Protein kinase C delta type-like n=1 Tax=Xenopus laevis TaxID=8355 RepID=A0A8J1KQ46_XENLA|nr:protein kinase C delta type-like [Xenopus laevis]